MLRSSAWKLWHGNFDFGHPASDTLAWIPDFRYLSLDTWLWKPGFGHLASDPRLEMPGWRPWARDTCLEIWNKALEKFAFKLVLANICFDRLAQQLFALLDSFCGFHEGRKIIETVLFWIDLERWDKDFWRAAILAFASSPLIFAFASTFRCYSLPPSMPPFSPPHSFHLRFHIHFHLCLHLCLHSHFSKCFHLRCKIFRYLHASSNLSPSYSSFLTSFRLSWPSGSNLECNLECNLDWGFFCHLGFHIRCHLRIHLCCHLSEQPPVSSSISPFY